MKLVLFSGQTTAYTIAADEFQAFYQKITGREVQRVQSMPSFEDAVVLCDPSCREYADPRIQEQSEDYSIVSKRIDGNNCLVITAGRGRAALYAVYTFFEVAAGCAYFWDGDVIPQKEEIPISGYDIWESPRFQYRAIRYFAHRGLHRFQAEHWSFEDWKREIDWLLKRRLNTFMLRIGMDDLFQKAFPDIVSYPSNYEVLPEATDGYNNRTTFWSLEYRGKLRKQVLDYAFVRDLLHPEDCGTMTHWYSRTPLEFLKKVKPTLLSQESTSYSEQTGLVWDISSEENLANYRQLTDTHVKEYGRADLFHTIGLAERAYSDDREKNLALKAYAYQKITEHVASKYPAAPLLIASWDFFFNYQAEEVRRLMKTFDPKRHIILDYTVDLKRHGNDFEDWDIVGKMPWIFGIFHAYQPQSHIHGDYPYLDRKMKVADEDTFCKGMAFWPELSHCDTFMLEYFTENAWRPTYMSLRERLERFCKKRYCQYAGIMQEIWEAFLPVYDLPCGSKDYMACFFDILGRHRSMQMVLDYQHCQHEEELNQWRELLGVFATVEPAMKSVVEKLRTIPADNAFVLRDGVDLLRTVAMKKTHYDFMRGAVALADGSDKAFVREKWGKCMEQLAAFARILAISEDFSAYHTFAGLRAVSQVNPHFENAMKDNLASWYSRSAVYETVRYLCLPEMQVFTEKILAREDRAYPDFEMDRVRIFNGFCKMDLEQMRPERQNFAQMCEAYLRFFD